MGCAVNFFGELFLSLGYLSVKADEDIVADPLIIKVNPAKSCSG